MEDYYKEKNKEKQKTKIVRKTLLNLIYIIVIPIIIWNLILIVKSIQNPNETPSVFGIKTFYIISKSMEPVIEINDLVIIKEVEQDEIKKGDIITFVSNNETITHRVINIEKQKEQLLFTTQGDANNIKDKNKVLFENIEGKYIGKIPKIGKIIMALKNKVTFVFILAFLIAIYMIEQKIDRKKIRRSIERIEYENKKNST